MIGVVDPYGLWLTKFGHFGDEQAVVAITSRMSAFGPQTVYQYSASNSQTKSLGLDAKHYAAKIRLRARRKFELDVVVSLESARAGITVIPFELARSVKLDAVERIENGSSIPLDFLERPARRDAGIIVMLDRPTEAGEALQLRFTAKGNEVFHRSTGDVTQVRTRFAWYPILDPLKDSATFDLRFESDPKSIVVATGAKMSAEVIKGRRHTHYVADYPIDAAAFNVGRYAEYRQQEDVTGRSISLHSIIPPKLTRRTPDMDKTAEAILADASTAVDIFRTIVGKAQFTDLKLTQQPQGFGQAFESLVFIPHMGQGMRQGPRGGGRRTGLYRRYMETVTIHEIAHQWFGLGVKPKSYRDAWLSEGFAEFLAIHALELAQQQEKAGEMWREHRELLRLSDDGRALAASAPISQGSRLLDLPRNVSYEDRVTGKVAPIVD